MKAPRVTIDSWPEWAGVLIGLVLGRAVYEVGRLVWRWLADHWDSGEDSYEVAELSVTAGLAERVPYDPEKHGEMDAEPGEDVIFFPLRGDPTPAQIVASVQAERGEGRALGEPNAAQREV